jgi:carotenoid cleavage dioxygenase-like enzyme
VYSVGLQTCPTARIQAPPERVWRFLITPSELQRWSGAGIVKGPSRPLTTDDESGKVTLRSLSDRFFQEFPRVDDRIISRRHRYGYTTAFKQLQDHIIAPTTATGHTSGNVLLKHDIEGGAVEEHRFEHGAAGEAVFAPMSLSSGEDEGYVMAFAHDLDGGNTDLVILAAQDFAGEPLARIHLPGTRSPGVPRQLDR